MDNRLEEIRKRDAQEIEAADMWIHHYTACADRRWLLGEVERLQERIQHKLEEEAAYLDTIRQYAETRDQYAAEVERLRESNQYFIGVFDTLDRFDLLGMLDNLGGDSDGVRFVVNEARRVLARQSELAEEFTGKIETVKLYPKALTPEETSNDYKDG